MWYNPYMKKTLQRIGKRISNFRIEAKPMAYTLLIMTGATLISFILHNLFILNNNVSMIYALAVVLVACVAPNYFYGVIASLISVIGVNYFFTAPYWELNFTMTGYPITFFLMLVTSIITNTLVIGYRERHRAIMEVEKEKLRSNLLRAISHDLRTPLTAISGSSAVLLEDRGDISSKDSRALLTDIHDNAQWLIRMVENLLSVTRIQSGVSAVKKVPEMAEEIVANAVLQVRKRFPGQAISIKVDDEPREVPMDGILIVQVIINLIENAIFHSGVTGPIQVSAHVGESEALFSVRDHGNGVDVQRVEKYMAGYVDPDRTGDSSRGMGIGLSLCAAIVSAHGGTLRAGNAEDGGAVFSFTLPLK